MPRKAKARKKKRTRKARAVSIGGAADARRLVGGLKVYHRDLAAKLTSVQVEIDAVGRAIEAMGAAAPAAAAAGGARRGPRARGGSLKDCIGKVLEGSSKAMTVAQLGQGVLRSGYKTKSKNLGNQISMALAQMAKKRQARKVARGLYSA